MDIGDVAKRSGMPPSTLRYYEKKGLIHSIGRNGLRRTFSTSVLERLAVITLGKRAGLSLDDIGNMLKPNGLEVDRERLLEKAEELDQQIKEMTAMRDGLKHAAACQAPRHMECPKFRRLLGLAADGAWSK